MLVSMRFHITAPAISTKMAENASLCKCVPNLRILSEALEHFANQGLGNISRRVDHCRLPATCGVGGLILDSSV